MISISLSAQTLSTVRFSVQPLVEAVDSLRALDDPNLPPFAAPWVRRATDRLRGADVRLLQALMASRCYVPDFLTPLPDEPARWQAQTGTVRVDKALAQVAETPAEQVAGELAMIFRELPMPTSRSDLEPAETAWLERMRGPMPAVVADALGDGEATFARRVADALATYWARVIEPDWPAIESVLEADIRYRSAQLAASGYAGLFADLHADLAWSGQAIMIPHPLQSNVAPATVILAPAVFGWPRLQVSLEPYQPVLISYPARGLAEGWSLNRHANPQATADLIGATRARLLADLADGRTTKELAARHYLTPSTASHHLRALHRAGLLERTRQGRKVLYQINQPGRQLLDRTG